MNAAGRGALVAMLVLTAASCVRYTPSYRKFTTSHDVIRNGMSLREVYEAGLADYMMTGQGANITGRTTVDAERASPECARVIIDIHYGSTDGVFSLLVECSTDRTLPREVAPRRIFQTKRDFLQGLDAQSSWVKSMEFDVESPALRIGGGHDRYSVVFDEHGKVAIVSAILLMDP
jgi:hypothetical protein